MASALLYRRLYHAPDVWTTDASPQEFARRGPMVGLCAVAGQSGGLGPSDSPWHQSQMRINFLSAVRGGAFVVPLFVLSGPFGCGPHSSDPGGLHSASSEEAESASASSTPPRNLVYFGYYQADRPGEIERVADHSTTLIMESEISDQNFARFRSQNLRVFLSLANVFFTFDPGCPCMTFLDEPTYLSNWERVRPIILRNRDVIAAFIPIDEPEFSRFPGTAELRRRDGLEAIARIVRRDVPGAQMAVNFWGTTVYSMASNHAEFLRRYPPSYDLEGSELYDRTFDAGLYRSLLSLTQNVRQPAPSIYLVPKAFLNEGNGRFPQPTGQAGLVSEHLERAYAFAQAEPRVVGFFAFLFRTIPEAGGTLRGASELPQVTDWMKRTGAAIRGGGANPAPNPNPSPTPTPTPTPQPGPLGDVPAQPGIADTQVGAFTREQSTFVAQRMYRAILGRNADAGGLEHWSRIVEQRRLPAAVSGFLQSAEFNARRPNLSATGWAADLYRQILDREPEPGAAEANANIIRQGRAAQRIVEIFLSPEYASKNRGGQAPTPSPQPAPNPGGLVEATFGRGQAATELWPFANAIDRQPGSCYSSRPGNASNGTREWIAAWLPSGGQSPRRLSRVEILPRVVAGREVGFPPTFDLFVTDPENRAWVNVRRYARASLPTSGSGRLVVQLPQVYSTHGVHIVPASLGVDHHGSHYLQLCEIVPVVIP